MRELNLLELGCFLWLLLLCMLLPFMLSLSYPESAITRRDCQRIVWLGQGILVLGAILILGSASFSIIAAVVGTVAYSFCAVKLWRKLRI